MQVHYEENGFIDWDQFQVVIESDCELEDIEDNNANVAANFSDDNENDSPLSQGESVRNSTRHVSPEHYQADSDIHSWSHNYEMDENLLLGETVLLSGSSRRWSSINSAGPIRTMRNVLATSDLEESYQPEDGQQTEDLNSIERNFLGQGEHENIGMYNQNAHTDQNEVLFVESRPAIAVASGRTRRYLPRLGLESGELDANLANTESVRHDRRNRGGGRRMRTVRYISPRRGGRRPPSTSASPGWSERSITLGNSGVRMLDELVGLEVSVDSQSPAHQYHFNRQVRNEPHFTTRNYDQFLDNSHLAHSSDSQNSNENISNRLPTVIDLTAEPDSPDSLTNDEDVIFFHSNEQNTRASERERARDVPSSGFTQSPGRDTTRGIGNNVIDLTEENITFRHSRPRIPQHSRDHDFELEVLNEGQSFAFPPSFLENLNFGNLVNGLNLRNLGMGILYNPSNNRNEHNNPLGPNPPNLNYAEAAFTHHPRNTTSGLPNHNIPEFQPPKSPPAGFTRDTGANGFKEDEVAVCPGCDEELAYDPNSDREGDYQIVKSKNAKSTSRSSKRKKSSQEHHAYVLKQCGHVSFAPFGYILESFVLKSLQTFCKRCYNSRGKKSTGFKNTLWRLENGMVADGTRWKEDIIANTQGKTSCKVLCAVDNCSTEVSKQSAWVGVFL